VRRPPARKDKGGHADRRAERLQDKEERRDQLHHLLDAVQFDPSSAAVVEPPAGQRGVEAIAARHDRSG
jgi:hypothetical protein